VDDTSSENKIPFDSVYSRLSRGPLSSLPGLHSGSSKTFASTELKEAFLKIYGGDFIMEWSEKKANDQEEEEKLQLTIVVRLPHDHASASSSSSPRLFQGALVCVNIKARVHAGDLGVFIAPISHTGSANVPSAAGQRFMDCLTMNQRDALLHRILHIFVRARGARTHETTMRGLIAFLSTFYGQKQSYWKEAIDLAMIAADIDFSNTPQYSKYIIYDVDRVAMALGADGRFQQAATLYEEIAAKFVSQYPSTATSSIRNTHDRQAHFYNNAGTTYMRAENYADAERVFVWALHHSLGATGGGTSWSSADPKTIERAFRNIIYLQPHWEAKEYRESAAGARAGSGGVSATTTVLEKFDATFENALRILARTAGFHRDEDEEKLNIVSVMKQKYMRKKVAQKTLALAVGSPVSVKKFRTTILECVRAGCIVKNRGRVEGGGSSTNVRRSHKQTARTEIASRSTDNNGDQRMFVKCNNPTCGKANDLSKFLYCPCHTVCYVSNTVSCIFARIFQLSFFYC
jgi:tetratricopeptide (TPR) repeat protein